MDRSQKSPFSNMLQVPEVGQVTGECGHYTRKAMPGVDAPSRSVGTWEREQTDAHTTLG